MSSEAILVLGKALGWIGIPLAWACWEVWRLRPGQEPEHDAKDAPEAAKATADETADPTH